MCAALSVPAYLVDDVCDRDEVETESPNRNVSQVIVLFIMFDVYKWFDSFTSDLQLGGNHIGI